MKSDLIDAVCMSLLKRGFAVKCLPRKWFDILARNSERILIIKALNDANSISHELADEMLKICSLLSATPLVIAEKAGELLEDGVVYSRFGIYTINFNTFVQSVDNKLPFIMKNQSGLTVSISGEKLSEEMEQKGFSLSEISRRIGVSKQMIFRYKKEKSEISLKKAELMNRIFGDSIFEKVDLFSHGKGAVDKNPSIVVRKYEELGFSAIDTRKAPFDIIAKGEKKIILTEVGDRTNPDFDSVTKLIDASRLVIFEKKKPAENSIPNISKEEFLDISTARELIKFLQEFE